MRIADVGVIRLRHILRPQSLHNLIHADPQRIARAAGARRRLIGHSVHGNGSRIKVVRNPGAALVNLNDSRSQQVRRYLLIDYLAGWRIKAFIAEEEIGFASKNLGEHRAADCAAIAVVVCDRNRRIAEIAERSVVVVPGVGAAKIRGMIVLVGRTVKVVGTALSNHLDLRAARSIEIGSLAGRVYFEFFNRIGRGRQHAAGRRPVAGERVVTIAAGIVLHASVHVVRVVAAIELEGVLVVHGAGNGSIWSDARLQQRKARCIGTEDRKISKGGSRNGCTDSGIYRLQFSARRSCDFHHAGHLAHLKNGIDC